MATCYYINFYKLLGHCLSDGGSWSIPQKMQSCIITGMTKDVLSIIVDVSKDSGVTCADYIRSRLIIKSGAIVMLNLRKLGHEHDICIVMQADNTLHVNSTKNAGRNSA